MIIHVLELEDLKVQADYEMTNETKSNLVTMIDNASVELKDLYSLESDDVTDDVDEEFSETHRFHIHSVQDRIFKLNNH